MHFLAEYNNQKHTTDTAYATVEWFGVGDVDGRRLLENIIFKCVIVNDHIIPSVVEADVNYFACLDTTKWLKEVEQAVNNPAFDIFYSDTICDDELTLVR